MHNVCASCCTKLLQQQQQSLVCPLCQYDSQYHSVAEMPTHSELAQLLSDSPLSAVKPRGLFEDVELEQRKLNICKEQIQTWLQHAQKQVPRVKATKQGYQQTLKDLQQVYRVII